MQPVERPGMPTPTPALGATIIPFQPPAPRLTPAWPPRDPESGSPADVASVRRWLDIPLIWPVRGAPIQIAGIDAAALVTDRLACTVVSAHFLDVADGVSCWFGRVRGRAAVEATMRLKLSAGPHAAARVYCLAELEVDAIIGQDLAPLLSWQRSMQADLIPFPAGRIIRQSARPKVARRARG